MKRIFNIIPWYAKILIILAFLVGIWALISNAISTVKTNITHAHKDYISIQKSDSLKTFLLAKCVNLSDTLLLQNSNLTEKIKSDSILNTALMQSHQKNELQMSKLIAQYRKNGACFIYEKEWVFGKKRLKEIPCDSLN